MGKTADQFRALQIFNTYDVLKRFGQPPEDVGISYHPAEARSVRPAMARVFSPSHKTDPGGGHWSDYGDKSFCGYRSESVLAAQEWASSRYGIRAWSPCPIMRGSYVPTVVRERALKYLKGSADDAEEA